MDGGRQPVTLGEFVAQLRASQMVSQALLADLAGCSRQYIAQLESGQRSAPSARIVTAIADALQLRGEVRSQLYEAAGLMPVAERPESWPELLAMACDVVHGVQYPAYVHDSIWRIWGWNREAENFFEVSADMLHLGVTTLLDLLFSPQYRQHFEDWDHWIRPVLAEFRRDSRGVIALAENRHIVRRLQGYPDFRSYWARSSPMDDSPPSILVTFRSHSGGRRAGRVVRLLYPGAGDLWVNIVLPKISGT